MNSTLSPPPTITDSPATTRLLLVRSEGSKTLLNGPDASPQTVGSGPRCSIRLDGPGLRPLHCVITPTDEGAVIRRWAAETRLNGSDFTEERLAAGDIVRVGSIDLRVVELLPSPPEVTIEPAPLLPVEVEAPADDPSDSACEVDACEVETSCSAAADAEPVCDEPAPVQEEAPESADEPIAESDEVAESVAQTLAGVKAAVEAVDPAIPSHLLKPWNGVEGDEHVADGDTATAEAPFDAFDEPVRDSANAAPEEPVEEPAPAAAPLAGEWAVAASDSNEDAEVVEPAVELSPEWEVEPSEDSASTSAPEVAVADEVEAIATPSEEPAAEADPEPVASNSFELSEPVAELAAVALPSRSIKGRLASNRLRVKNLVAALRAEREQATLWQTAVAEREAALLTAQEQINEASAAAELNETTRQELADANERIAVLEAECAEALAAAEAATERAEALEQQLAEQATPVAEPVEAVAEVVLAVEATAEVEEKAGLVEGGGEETPAPTEEPETAASVWEQETAAEASETDSPAEPLVVSEPEASIETEAAIEPEVEAEPVAQESLWGIEQLAADDDSSAESDPEPLMPGDELAEPTAEVADETPKEEPAEAAAWPESPQDELEASPSDHLVASAALEAVTPAQESEAEKEAEPSALAAELISELDEAGPELKDPFARPEAEASREPHQAPASFIEQYADQMPEEDEPVDPPAPIDEPAPIAAEAAPADDSDDEESIDDYMRKLMGRVRGDAPAASASASPGNAVKAQPAAESTEAAPPKPAEPVVPIRDLSEMKRAPNREITTDMGALRKLANQSARHAIDVAATRQSREQATLRLTVSAVAIGCGALASITALSPFGMQFVGGLAGLSAGSWFGLKTLRACQAAARQDELEAAAAGESIG